MTHTSHTIRRAAMVLGALALVAVPASAQQARAVRLSLDDALRMAEPKSEAIAIARAAVTRATGNKFVTRSQALPQIGGSVAYTKTLKSQFDVFASAPEPDPTAPKSLCTPEISANATQAERDAALAQATSCSSGGGIDFSAAGFGARNQWAGALNGSWNVFTGGRIAGQTRAAVAQERSATIEVAAQRAQLQLDVAQAYYDAALSDQLVAVAVSSLAQTERILEQTTVSKEVGDVAEFDLLRAKVTRDNQLPGLIRARSDREVAYLRLKQLLEIPPGDSLILSSQLEGDGTSLATAAAEAMASRLAAASRAPVRQLEQAVVAQEGLVRAAKAERWPQVQIVSGFQRLYFPLQLFPDFGQARQNWTVGVQANVPIFTGGRIKGSTMMAESNLEDTRQQLSRTRELADLDSRVAFTNLEQAQAAYVASTGTSEQAARALAIDEVRFREGISTQTDLTQTRLLVEQATINRAIAARNLHVARLRVQLLTDLPLQLGGSTGFTPRQQ